MNKSEFERLYMCTFEPDPVILELDEAFDNYYKKSENLNDSEAHMMWGQLKDISRSLGVTPSQFHEAKMRATGRIR